MNDGLQTTDISIHAPLAGRDCNSPTVALFSAHFNPRAPCGARPRRYRPCRASSDFNPRAPCGARRSFGYELLMLCRISIHAPLAGRDLLNCTRCRIPSNFNPRAPCGARRQKCTDFLAHFCLKQTKKLWFSAESAVCWGGFSRRLGEFVLKMRCEPPRKSLIAWGSRAAAAGVRQSAFLPADRSGGSRSVRSCSRSFSPDNKSEGCRARGP